VECEYVGGAARPLEVAEFAWVAPGELAARPFPPANAGLLRELAAGARGRATPLSPALLHW
jgi:hypothetical protein